MLKPRISTLSIYITLFIFFGLIECFAQNSNFIRELQVTTNENKVSLKWNSLVSEPVASFNIYRVEIDDKNKDSKLADLSFKNIGSTKELSFTDEFNIDELKNERNFSYYVAALDKNGKEIGKSEFGKAKLLIKENKPMKEQPKSY